MNIMKENLREYWLKKPKDNELIQIANKIQLTKIKLFFIFFLLGKFDLKKILKN